MNEKEKEYLIKAEQLMQSSSSLLAESVSIIQDCLFDIAKRLQELEKSDGDK